MRLSHFRISNYKVIDDTGWVPVDARVTALVGRNESGKTAVLKAMWKSRNVAAVNFDKLHDYPRDRYAKERKGSQDVVSLKFALSEQESNQLAEVFGLPLDPKPKEVVYTTRYKSEDGSDTLVTFEEAFTNQHAAWGAVVRERMRAVMVALKTDAGTLGEVETELDQAIGQVNEGLPLWDDRIVGALDAFNAAVNKWVAEDESRQAHGAADRQQLTELIAHAKRGDPTPRSQQWVKDNLPVFIYFSDYGQLETRIHLPSHIQRRGTLNTLEGRLAEITRTQVALFDWSSLDPAEILELGKARASGQPDAEVQRRLEKRRALLDSASVSLTGDWIDWWTERTHRLHLHADGEDLVLRVSDQYNEFPIPFEERSHGFQWFFSFYLVFLVESQKAHRGAILLLDEPGLHLHPTLQTRLIALFERISNENQLLYTTHLPFLVDGEHLERVRTVYLDEKGTKKTVVSTDVRPAGDKDTLFPLQAAIGYSIAQTLFFGKRSVIVEGITDYWLLKALSDCLASIGGHTILHGETVLIPAGGTSRLMPLASIMFATSGVGGRQLLVLLDSDKEGQQAAQRVRELFRDDASGVLMLGEALGRERATIEDLLPRQVYVDAVAKGTGKTIELGAEEMSASTNVAAMEKFFESQGLGKFGTDQKAAATLALLRTWGENPENVPTETRELVSKLFAAINRRFCE